MLQRTFFAMAVIVIVSRAIGMLFARVHQPVVIGEIVGGIILGPTLVGAVVGNRLFPLAIRPSLNLVGQLGLALYMFMVGMRLHARTARTHSRRVTTISLASVGLPFLLGMPLAAFLYPHHKFVGGQAVKSVAFFLFVGLSLSITAFPVLTRILEERRLQDSTLGVIAIACAAVQDLAGWCLLAVILVITSADSGAWSLVRMGLESVACVAGIVVVSKLLGHVRRFDAGSMLLPGAVVSVLVCAGATQAVGLHAVFGAFLLGIAVRRSLPNRAREEVTQRLGPITTQVLLPVYFIIPGLSVNLRALDLRDVSEIALILVAACVGKIGGAYVSSRACGLAKTQSALMGALMNTRGLVEVVVLQVALSAGILDGKLFSELVLMAVLTTLMTQPLLTLLLRSSRRQVGEAKAAADMFALDSG